MRREDEKKTEFGGVEKNNKGEIEKEAREGREGKCEKVTGVRGRRKCNNAGVRV